MKSRAGRYFLWAVAILSIGLMTTVTVQSWLTKTPKSATLPKAVTVGNRTFIPLRITVPSDHPEEIKKAFAAIDDFEEANPKLAVDSEQLISRRADIPNGATLIEGVVIVHHPRMVTASDLLDQNGRVEEQVGYAAPKHPAPPPPAMKNGRR